MKIPRPEAPAEEQARTITCPECGAAHEADSTGEAHCDDCRVTQRREVERHREKGSATARGYGYRWRQLSRRARRLQDFCTDCGSPDDLTADHSREAWAAHEAGKVITLDMVDVVCIRCNGERGAARGSNATDEWRQRNGEQFARILADEVGE